jgi:PqqD family protein of HPr-rel-A system
LPGISIKQNDSGRFVERRLGDSVALFDTTSGETHLLSPEVLVLIELLQSLSGKSDLLAEELAHHIDGTEQEIQNFIDQTLGNLQDIGFIEIEEFT